MGKSRLLVGITGMMGSGKSFVLETFSSLGADIWSADEQIQSFFKSAAILKKISDCFGADVIDAQGHLDRKKLSHRAFMSRRKVDTLTGILYPPLLKKFHRWHHQGQGLKVAEVPLLFETGMDQEFDVTVYVSVPTHIRRRRIQARGFSWQEVRRREKYQWTALQKRKKADAVISNEKAGKRYITRQVKSFLKERNFLST